MTSTNRASGGVPAAEASVESEPWHNDWDPGSYLDAVREDLASAFATAPSLPPAVQGTNPIAKPLRIQETPRSTPGRTSIHGRPIILRNLDKHSSSLLTQEEPSHLLRSLTQRDVAILQALHDYRYLNTLQIQQLFFHGIRSTQMRLHFLSDHGLLYRWQMIEPPGLTRRASMLLLTPRGGRLLAEFRGHSPWSAVSARSCAPTSGSTKTPKAPTANTCCLSCIGRVARNCFTDWPVSSFLLGAIAAGSGPPRSSALTTSARWARSGRLSKDPTPGRMTTRSWSSQSRSTSNGFVADV